MPLKLNIAMSRKIGEPNYGSRGATVGLEMEVESNLVNTPRRLHLQIARLFRLAKASIDYELGCRSAASVSSSNGTLVAARNRPATANQIRAIHAIAARHGLNLADELRERFEIDRPENLSLEQASQLIDAITSSANGEAVQD